MEHLNDLLNLRQLLKMGCQVFIQFTFRYRLELYLIFWLRWMFCLSDLDFRLFGKILCYFRKISVVVYLNWTLLPLNILFFRIFLDYLAFFQFRIALLDLGKLTFSQFCRFFNLWSRLFLAWYSFVGISTFYRQDFLLVWAFL